MDKLESMQRFLVVAQCGSFTRAAELLGLPKSSVSSAVQALEKHLGTRLFHRSTRRIVLTQDGQAYLPQCQSLLAELEALESQFQQVPDDVRGVLRLDVPSRFASAILFPHLQEWFDLYPHTQLKVSCSDSDIDLVHDGVDCVLRVGTLADSALIARPVGTYRIVNCASPAYIKRYGTPHAIDDLRHHRLIAYSPTMGSAPAAFEYVADGVTTLIDMPSALCVNNTDAYLSACLAGLGIAQIPSISVRSHLQDGSLVALLPETEAESMPISLLYPTRRHVSKRLSLFLDWVESLVKRVGL